MLEFNLFNLIRLQEKEEKDRWYLLVWAAGPTSPIEENMADIDLGIQRLE